jgi:PPM family protein phosphatase
MQYLTYTNQGSKDINEDAFFANDKLFMVCDGVGGNVYGEIASTIACTALSEYFINNASEIFTDDLINDALKHAVDVFRAHELEYPETKGMSTTVVLATFDDEGVIILWLGDSRCYHIRNGVILFETKDHTLLNEIQNPSNDGEIDLKSVRNFVTKTMSAKCNFQLSKHCIKVSEIKNGDFLFLCTDGVMENLNNEKIAELFLAASTLEGIKQNIVRECEGKTKDNYTFEIIKLSY